MRRLGAAVWPLAALAGLWWALAAWLDSPFVPPAPGQVASSAAALWSSGELGVHLTATLLRVLAAFVMALVAGGLAGLLMGRSALARACLRPVVSFFFPVPKVAAFPALVILFGLGGASKIALGFAEAVFPIAVATAAAASQVGTPLVWSAAGMGLRGRGLLLRVVLPAALPGMLAGARVGLVGCVIGVYVGEMIVSSEGLGHLLVVGWRQLETPQLYVSVVMVSLAGFILDRLLLAASALLPHGTSGR